MDKLIFLIERGKPLALVKRHIAERERVRENNIALCKALGVTKAAFRRTDGTLDGVVFKDNRHAHADWKKPDRRGVSYPKKGSEWAKRLAAQVGYADPAIEIAEAFHIPTHLEFGDAGSRGWKRIGSPLHECGYLFLSPEGPYALWIPDVPEEIAKVEQQGDKVRYPKSFKPEIDGCRCILQEEWDLMVAEHNLSARQADLLVPA